MPVPLPENSHRAGEVTCWGTVVVTSDGLSDTDLESFGANVEKLVAGCCVSIHTILRNLECEMIALPRHHLQLSPIEIKKFVTECYTPMAQRMFEKLKKQKKLHEKLLHTSFKMRPFLMELKRWAKNKVPASVQGVLSIVMMLVGERTSLGAFKSDTPEDAVQSIWLSLQNKIVVSGGGEHLLQKMIQLDPLILTDDQTEMARKALDLYDEGATQSASQIVAVMRMWSETVMFISECRAIQYYKDQPQETDKTEDGEKKTEGGEGQKEEEKKEEEGKEKKGTP